MSTFDQIKAMQKLTETLARCDLPNEWDAPDADLGGRPMRDIHIFYGFIEEARAILKQGRKRKPDSSKPADLGRWDDADGVTED